MTSAFERLWSGLRRLLHPGDDALADYRDRITLHLSLLAAALLVPFVAVHLLAGRLLLAGVIVGAQVILLINGRALWHGRPVPVPFWLMCGGLGGAVCASTLLQGVNGLTWSYPVLFLFFFVLRRSVALLLALLLVVGMTAAAGAAVGAPIAGRAFATLGLTLVMINVVLNVIADLQRALVAQTITDPLTGAYNRRHLDAQLAQLSPPTPGVGAVNMLLAVDLDHFKAINDSLGHAAGDGVLQGTVAVLNSRTRPSDRLFRTGGEEFVLLLPRITPADAARLAEDLRQLIEAAPLLEDRRVTVCIGLAAQRADRDVSTWLSAADAALYEAKRSGRNRVVVGN